MHAYKRRGRNRRFFGNHYDDSEGVYDYIQRIYQFGETVHMGHVDGHVLYPRVTFLAIQTLDLSRIENHVFPRLFFLLRAGNIRQNPLFAHWTHLLFHRNEQNRTPYMETNRENRRNGS